MNDQKLPFLVGLKTWKDSGRTHKELVEYLNADEIKVSTAQISTLKREYKEGKLVEKNRVRLILTGMQKLIKEHLGYEWINNQYTQTATPTASLIPKQRQPYTIHLSRLDDRQKATFFSSAKQEVIVVGIKLEKLVNLFEKEDPSKYADFVEDLLIKGVDFCCYQLAHSSQYGKIYVEDRAKIDTKELQEFEKLPLLRKQLTTIANDYNSRGYKGKLRLFSYDHIPTCNVLAVDLKGDGKMMVSNYLYGVRRGLCPVIEVHQEGDSALYNKYADMLRAFLKGALELN